MRWRDIVLSSQTLRSMSIIKLKGPGADDKKKDKGNDEVNLGDRFFSPFGRHLLNDSLHSIGFFPGMSGLAVCQEDNVFITFKDGLFSYISQFDMATFRHFCCLRTNSDRCI